MAEYVIVQERSAGNAEVGSMWVETAVFPETATLADVAAWLAEAKSIRSGNNIGDGRVMIQIAQRPADD